MPRPFASRVELASEGRLPLEALLRARSTPQGLALRCRIVLRAAQADNPSNQEIAAELGGHYEQAGDFSKAVEYVCLTAQNAWRRFAYAEAIIICERGLLITERLPENERIAWEMRFPKCVPCSRWHRTNPLARCRRWKHWPLAPPGMAWRRLRLAHSFIKWSSGRAVILAPVFRSWIACGRCLPSTRVH